MSRFADLRGELEELASSSQKQRLSWSSDDPSTQEIPSTPSGKADEVDEKSTPMSSSTDETMDSLMSLTDINQELEEIIACVNKGGAFDEKRLDYLIEMQRDHPEHQMNLERENREWMLSIEDFLAESLAKTRSFVPVDVSRLGTVERVMEEGGVSMDVAKRVLEKKALWLCRMKDTDISRIHIVDLLHKYCPLGVNLDIVETAAVFACMPEYFSADTDGKKEKFRDDLISTLKEMISDQKIGKLPPARQRNPVYGHDAFGPIEDITSTVISRVTSMKGISQEELDGVKPRRRSFTEVCRRHSLLSKERRTDVGDGDDDDDDDDEDSGSGSGSGDEEEKEEEEVYGSMEGTTGKTEAGRPNIVTKQQNPATGIGTGTEIDSNTTTATNTHHNSSGNNGRAMAARYNAKNSPGVDTTIFTNITSNNTTADLGDGDGRGMVVEVKVKAGAATATATATATTATPTATVREKGNENKNESGNDESSKSEKSAFEKGTNLYVEYGGADLVHHGWLHRSVNAILPTAAGASEGSAALQKIEFQRYFIVCTRSDSFMRVFANENDVEETGTINMQTIVSCAVTASVPSTKDASQTGSGGDNQNYYFVLTDLQGRKWYFRSDSPENRSSWVEKLQPLLKKK